jgi:hypothetical protein
MLPLMVNDAFRTDCAMVCIKSPSAQDRTKHHSANQIKLMTWTECLNRSFPLRITGEISAQMSLIADSEVIRKPGIN